MKKIIKFLLIIAIFMPFMANAECTSSTSQDACVCPGYGWDNDLGCVECRMLFYNHGSASSCKSCGSYDNGVWTWGGEASTHPGNSVFDPVYDNTPGLSSCPWVCATGYYRSSYNENTGADECKQCGDDWTGCDNPGATSATVGCPSGSYKTINSETGVVTCTQCGRYAFAQGGECVCKGNTYGDPYAGCTKCPAGMLTVVTTSETDAIHDPNFRGEPGATRKNQCKIGAFTKFCNGNGEHCMRLMQ